MKRTEKERGWGWLVGERRAQPVKRRRRTQQLGQPTRGRKKERRGKWGCWDLGLGCELGKRRKRKDWAERDSRRKDGLAQGKEKKGKRREGEAWADLKGSKNWAGSKEKEEGKRRKWPAGLGS